MSFRSARKLSDYLVKAQIYRIERSVGSFKCGKKLSEVCKNVNKTRNLTSSVTFNTYRISYRLNCDHKCLIYTIKIFYESWSNYKNNTRKFLRGDIFMQQNLFKHFQKPCQTGFIKEQDIPTKRENYLRQNSKLWLRIVLTLNKVYSVVFRIIFSDFVYILVYIFIPGYLY